MCSRPKVQGEGETLVAAISSPFHRIWRAADSLQSHLFRGYCEVKGWAFRPGPSVNVSDAIENPVLAIVGVAAGHRAIAVGPGAIHGIHHDVPTEDLIEHVPFLGIMGHVYRFCPQLDPHIVHHLEGLHKSTVPGHDLVELVPMHDQEPVPNVVMGPKTYVAEVSRQITIVMVPPHPNNFLVIRTLLYSLQDTFLRWLQFVIRAVNDVPI